MATARKLQDAETKATDFGHHRSIHDRLAAMGEQQRQHLESKHDVAIKINTDVPPALRMISLPTETPALSRAGTTHLTKSESDIPTSSRSGLAHHCCSWYPSNARVKVKLHAIGLKALQIAGTLGAGLGAGIPSYSASDTMSNYIDWNTDVANYTVLGASVAIGLVTSALAWRGIERGLHYISFFEPRVESLEKRVEVLEEKREKDRAKIKDLKHKLESQHTEIGELREMVNAQNQQLQRFLIAGDLTLTSTVHSRRNSIFTFDPHVEHAEMVVTTEDEQRNELHLTRK